MSLRDDDAMNTFDSTPFRLEWTQDGHVTEESTYAWLDGALADADSDLVESHVQICFVCSAAVAEARGFIAASVRIMNAADLSPRNVVPHIDVVRTAAKIVALADQGNISTMRTRNNVSSTLLTPVLHRWYQRPAFSAAATLLLLVGGAYYVTTRLPMSAPGHISVATSRTPNTVAPTVKERMRDSVQRFTPPVSSSTSPLIAGKTAATKTRMSERVVQRRKLAVSTQIPSSVPAPLPLGSESLPVVVVAAPATASERKVMSSTLATIGGVADEASLRTITGSIRERTTSKPLEAVHISVPGTTLGAMTDAAGTFTLSNVPAEARSLLVRRLGYEVANVSLDTVRGVTASVNVSLTAAFIQLNGVTVASAATPAPRKEKQTSCFTVSSEGVGQYAPLVRGIQWETDGSGTYQATLQGWPQSNDLRRATFIANEAGELRGAVTARGNRLDLEIKPQGDTWIVTLREYRGTNVRSENVVFKRVAQGCQ